MNTIQAVIVRTLLAVLFCGTAHSQFEVGRLVAADGQTGDRFGHSVAIDGDTIIVGAPETMGPTGREGAAYIFRQVQGAWVQEAKLVPPSLPANSRFGESVAISGNRVAVGAPLTGGWGSYDGGRVFVFRRTGQFPFAVWSLQQELGPNSSSVGVIGTDVAISGGILVTSSCSTNLVDRVEPAVVYELSGGTWAQSALLVHPQWGPGAQFGWSVRVDGGTICVGAPNANLQVVMFEKLNSAWTCTGSIAGPQGSLFGRSVDRAGDLVVVGDGWWGGNLGPGSVWAYRQSGGAWMPLGNLTNPQGHLGTCVATNGLKVLGTAPGVTSSTGALIGALGIAEATPTSLSGQGALTAKQPTTNGEFGASLDLSGDLAVVGAPRGDGINPATGSVLVFSMVPPQPVVYCGAKLNSAGCFPAVIYSGSASLGSSGSFIIEAQQVVNGKVGLLFFGTSGRVAFPFQGGTLCVLPPTRRTQAQQSGGSAVGVDCSGTYSYDFNVLLRSGTYPDLDAGVLVNAQYWYRDPASPSTTGLTNAIEFGVGF